MQVDPLFNIVQSATFGDTFNGLVAVLAFCARKDPELKTIAAAEAAKCGSDRPCSRSQFIRYSQTLHWRFRLHEDMMQRVDTLCSCAYATMAAMAFTGKSYSMESAFETFVMPMAIALIATNAVTDCCIDRPVFFDILRNAIYSGGPPCELALRVKKNIEEITKTTHTFLLRDELIALGQSV